MDNNEMKFDPMTGQPIQSNPIQPQSIQPVEPLVSIDNQQMPNVPVDTQLNTTNNNINNIQADPTVEQSRQNFINSTQTLSAETKKEKKEGVNWAFIIIMFVIILAAIIFVFPYLLKNL